MAFKASNNDENHSPYCDIWKQMGSVDQYRKICNIRRTESQKLNASRLGLQLSLRNILKPGVKSRMKMSEWSTI